MKHTPNLQLRVSPFEEHQRSQKKKKNRRTLNRAVQWIMRTRIKGLVIFGTDIANMPLRWQDLLVTGAKLFYLEYLSYEHKAIF